MRQDGRHPPAQMVVVKAMTKRIEYINVAKFLAMLLVVFCHGFKEGHFVAFAYSFHLPVFFFLNGMTLKLENQEFGSFLTKKLKNFIIPMFGLGILTVLFQILVKSLLNQNIPDNVLLVGLARIINQTRTFAIWFLPSLFFTNLMMFGIHRLFKGKVFLMSVGALAILGLGLLFNRYHNVSLVWNFDTALIGIVFTYFGYLFKSKSLSRIYGFVIDGRWLSLIIGLGLLVGTYFLSTYHYDIYHRHLEMYFRIYNPPYLVLPCALIGCFGFVLFCRGISNFVLAKPVEINLALLPLHQELAFPLFRSIIAKEWWMSVAALPPTDYRFILFALTLATFSLAVATVIHFILKYSPLSPIVNQPLASFYRVKKTETNCVMHS